MRPVQDTFCMMAWVALMNHHMGMSAEAIA